MTQPWKSSLLRKMGSDIISIIDNYDKQAFLQFCQDRADDPTLMMEFEELDLDRATVMAYQKLLARCASQIVEMGKAMGAYSLPAPAWRRVVSEIGAKLPNELLKHFTPDLAFDNYFGATYDPGRYNWLYEPGAKEILAEIIRREWPWEKAIAGINDPDSWIRSGVIDMSGDVEEGVRSFIDIWGEQTVKSWWAGITPQDIQANPYLSHFQGPLGSKGEPVVPVER